MQLCLGFIAANAAAEEAARMAARARWTRQLVGKKIFRCYQCILLLYSCTRRLEDNRIYCCTRNLVCTSNIPLLPVYITLSAAVLSFSYMYSSVLQLVHVGWKIIEYTVVHATSRVLYCALRCTKRVLGMRVYCCALGTSRRY